MNDTTDALSQCGPYEQALYLQYQRLGEVAYTNPPTNREMAAMAGMCVNRMKQARARLAELGLIQITPVLSRQGYCNQPPAVRVTAVATAAPLSSGDTPHPYHDTPLPQDDTPYHDVTPTTGDARVRERAALTTQKQIQDPPVSPQRHESPPARRSRAAKPVYADVDEDTRLGLIRAWASGLAEKAPLGVEKSDKNHETAAEIARAGYSADDVAAFVKAKMADPYWDGKTLTFQKVAELLPGWKATRQPSGAPKLTGFWSQPPPDNTPRSTLTPEERAELVAWARQNRRAVFS